MLELHPPIEVGQIRVTQKRTLFFDTSTDMITELEPETKILIQACHSNMLSARINIWGHLYYVSTAWLLESTQVQT